MRSILRFSAVAFAAASFALIAMPASADEVVSVAPFKSVSLHGGGKVTLRHGDVQRVTITRDTKRYADIHTSPDNELVIDVCKHECPRHYNLEIEIVTPAIAGVSIHGGGEIDSVGEFPVQPTLNAAIHGGGEINLRGLAAKRVSVAVHGGGAISVTAKSHLSATVHGGGEITYWGHPSVTTVIHGGGSVERGS